MELIEEQALSENDEPLTVTADFMLFAAGRNLITLSPDSKEKIFPGHTKEILCSTASPSGRRLASAEQGNVIIWDSESGESLAFSVESPPKVLKFSPTEEFLGILEQNGQFELFDLKGNRIGKAQQKYGSFIEFFALSNQKRADFYCISADENRVFIYTFKFDRAQLIYKLSFETIQIPYNGTVRNFTCGTVYYPYAYLGTPNGEIAVFDLHNKVFRTLLKEFTGAVTEVWSLSEHCLCASSDNGELITLHGSEVNFVVESETAIDAPILTFGVNNDEIIVLSANGVIVEFLLQQTKESSFRFEEESASEFNKRGNIGELPGERGYNSTMPHLRERDEERVEKLENQEDVFSIDTKSLLVLHAFPEAPLLKNALMILEKDEIIIGGTENGLLEAWEEGCLLAQMKFNGPCNGLAVAQNLIICCFGDMVYCVAYDGEELEVSYTVPSPKTCCIACNTEMFAVGGIDGRIFIYELIRGNEIERFTDGMSHVLAICFDNVIPQLVHASFSDGFIATYDIEEGKKIKNRSVSPEGACHDMEEETSGRHELVCGCIDCAVRFFDFDVQDAVEIAELPDECCSLGKMYCGMFENRLVAGGCKMDGDEVMALMRQGEEDWNAVDCVLSEGVEICGILVGEQNVYVLGKSGEIVVYEWK